MCSFLGIPTHGDHQCHYAILPFLLPYLKIGPKYLCHRGFLIYTHERRKADLRYGCLVVVAEILLPQCLVHTSIAPEDFKLLYAMDLGTFLKIR